MTQDKLTGIEEAVKSRFGFVARVKQELSRTIVGQDYLLDRLILGMLSDGHVLVEGVPGLAKTLAVKTLAQAAGCSFNRIQFTPDLLPADLVGTQIYRPQTGNFETKKGPIFSQVVIADEINRAPAKVQSALLEAMEERQVTIGETSYILDKPFLVLATMNPIEQEGTYSLPEAQVDRFMLKLDITYPTKKDELGIMARHSQGFPEVQAVVGPEHILDARKVVALVHLEDRLLEYIVDLVHATRDPEGHGLGELKGMIQFGASPRAAIYLQKGARAMAFIRGRAFVMPEDIKAVAADILRHRILLSYEAEAEDVTTGDVVASLLNHVKVP
ncbi:MAG: MoxR family ATPase [Myxococcota bacterium]|nr:MoxR family ATPase [Myxococcota bacterium]